MPLEVVLHSSTAETPSPPQPTPPRPDAYPSALFSPGALPLPKVHRGWERAPESPFVKRGPSHKIWKRYEAPVWDAAGATEGEAGAAVGIRRTEGVARVVKRQRVEAGGREDGEGYRATQTVAEGVQTPRRKRAASLAMRETTSLEAKTVADSIEPVDNRPAVDAMATSTDTERDIDETGPELSSDNNSVSLTADNIGATSTSTVVVESAEPKAEAADVKSPSTYDNTATDAEPTSPNNEPNMDGGENLMWGGDDVGQVTIPVNIQSAPDSAPPTPAAPLAEPCITTAADMTSPESEDGTSPADEEPMSPTQEVTVTFTAPQFPNIQLDYDTEILKDFLSRAAASKASKSANPTKRESLENQRDSNLVREALSSPAKARQDKELASPTINLELPSEPILPVVNKETPAVAAPAPVDGPSDNASTKPVVEDEDTTSTWNPRRSLRARVVAESQAQTKKRVKISLNDTRETVKLRTEARELANLTRRNTGRNKFGAQAVHYRLKSIAAEAQQNVFDELDAATKPSRKKKQLKWHSSVDKMELVRETTANDTDATPETAEENPTDEIEAPSPSRKSSRARTSTRRQQQTARTKRAKGLGATNGTPGKLSQGSLLKAGEGDAAPEVEERSSKLATITAPKPPVSSLPVPAPPPTLSLPVPSDSNPTKRSLSTITPSALSAKPDMALNADMGVDSPVGPVAKDLATRPVVERKSRLVPPRKVKIDGFSPAVEGKENRLAPVKKLGGAAGEPRKRRLKG